MKLRQALAVGALGGTAGAALMLPLFEGAKRIGLLREAPPVRVVERAAEAARASGQAEPLSKREQLGTAWSSHLLYGAAASACYGLVQKELDLPALVAGPTYGLLLWAAGYLGWIPAAGVLPQPWRQRTGDALTPVAAHLVYGLTLGLIERRLRQ